jgi:hypothetical protein
MRRAIGTSIRSATNELRKLEHHRQQQMDMLQNDENLNPDEREERIQNAIDDLETVLNANDNATDDEDKEDDEELDEADDDEGDDDGNNLTIDEELDEDED